MDNPATARRNHGDFGLGILGGKMTVTVNSIKEQIFEYGLIDADWENDELGTVHQIQAQAEFILSEKLTDGEITYSETKQLMQNLLAEYGYDYPILTTADIYREAV